MSDEYKAAKEAFVSGMTGSSVTHINLLSLVALVSVALYGATRTRIAPTRSIGLLSSWFILVLPMLLAMTVAANQPIYLTILLLLPTLAVLRLPRAEFGTPLPSSQPASPVIEHFQPKFIVKIAPLPALTTYRSHMMLMTVLAILAVDFPVFPRSLAKCETFGVSLMDMGVGSFVFSQGIVSAIPLVKDANHLTAPFVPKLSKVAYKSLPIIALGVVRVILVKGTEYPEHVTEYGVHWNFFITLALLPILQVLLHPVLRRLPISAVGVLVGSLQQFTLSHFSLKQYVLSAPRTSMISANKEGIVSLLGYLAIQLLGLSVGTLVLPPTPSFFRRRQEALIRQDKKRRNSNAADSSAPSSAKAFDVSAPRQTGKTATELSGYAILWWTLVGVTKLIGVDGKWGPEGGVSRRMVNLPYILWVTAYNTSFLLAYLVVLDISIFSPPGPKKDSASKHRQLGNKADENPMSPVASQSSGDGAGFLGVPSDGPSHVVATTVLGNPPKLLNAINRHGLVIFLIANVLTGVINLSISTMFVKDGWALCILSMYSVALCAVAWLWAGFRLK